MKRIEAIIRDDKLQDVVDALNKEAIDGFTIIESLGQGNRERPWIGGVQGKKIDFNANYTIITVIDDSKVDSVIDAIVNSAATKSKGNGAIFVTNVEQVKQISTL